MGRSNCNASHSSPATMAGVPASGLLRQMDQSGCLCGVDGMACPSSFARRLSGQMEEETGRVGHRLIEGAAATFVLRGLQAASAYVLQIALARWLSLAAFGAYALTMAWVTVLATVGALGMPNLLVRFLPGLVGARDWEHARGILVWALSISLVVSSAIGMLLFVVGVTGIAGRGPMGGALAVGAIAVPSLALGLILVQAGRALGHPVLTFAPQALLGNLGALVVAGAWVAAGHTLSPALVVGFWAALAVTVVAIQLRALWSVLPVPVRHAVGQYRTAAWTAVAAPLLATACLYVLMERADLLLVGGLLSSADAGLYNAASRTAALVSFVPFATAAVAAPRFAALYAENRRREMRTFFADVRKWTWWPAAALAVGLALFGRDILMLFGGRYLSAWPALEVLCGGQAAAAAAGPVAVALIMTGRQKLFVGILAAGVGMSILLNLLLIPKYATLGAAVATAASITMWTWLAGYAWRRSMVRETNASVC